MEFLANILSALGSAGATAGNAVVNAAQAAAPVVAQTANTIGDAATKAALTATHAGQAAVKEGAKFKLSQLPNMFMDFMNTKQAQWNEEQTLQRQARLNMLKQLAGVDATQQPFAQPIIVPQQQAPQMQVQIPQAARNGAATQFNWNNDNKLFKL